MENTVTTSRGRSKPAFVAPLGHTLGLLGILLLMLLGGLLQQRRGHPGGGIVGEHRGVVPLYLTLLGLEYGLLRYVMMGFRRRGTRLRDVIGGEWTDWRRVAIDVAIAVAFWFLWREMGAFVKHALGPDAAKSIDVLLPRGGIEIGLWVAVSAAAGFCEEVVYRGYLQRQLLALTGSAPAAVLGQAVLFGISHGYQGAKAMITITIYGALFGLLALWRLSLRPGMLAHAWTDIFSGILRQ
jgi:hypothetical protein